METDLLDLRKAGVGKFGKNVTVRDTAMLYQPENIVLGHNTYVGRYCELVSGKGKIIIGDGSTLRTHCYLDVAQPNGAIHLGTNTWIGPYCILYGHNGLYIGNNVMIAARTSIIPYKHEWRNSDVLISEQPGICIEIRIGDGAYIGANCTIMANIGTGAVVGAGAVVTRDVPAMAVVVGVPAHVIATRGSPPKPDIEPLNNVFWNPQ